MARRKRKPPQPRQKHAAGSKQSVALVRGFVRQQQRSEVRLFTPRERKRFL
jgi:hypothetical protein